MDVKRAKIPPVEGTARDRLVDAALEVFAEQGFEGARTRDIAARAGENLGLISYYFGNKEALWREAVGAAFAELGAELLAVAGTDDGETPAFERMLRRFVQFLVRRPAFMQLMNDESRRDGDRMRWLVDTHVEPFARAVTELAGADDAGAGIPAASLHYIVLGAAGLMFSQAPECRRLFGVDPFDPAVADAHADALVRIFSALAPPR